MTVNEQFQYSLTHATCWRSDRLKLYSIKTIRYWMMLKGSVTRPILTASMKSSVPNCGTINSLISSLPPVCLQSIRLRLHIRTINRPRKFLQPRISHSSPGKLPPAIPKKPVRRSVHCWDWMTNVPERPQQSSRINLRKIPNSWPRPCSCARK